MRKLIPILALGLLFLAQTAYAQEPVIRPFRGWIFPTDPKLTITAPFCADNTPWGGEKCHTGEDVGTAQRPEAKIVAAESGIVKLVQNDWAGYQNWTIILFHGWDENGTPVSTQYSHVREVLVQEGQIVDRGQQIATAFGTNSARGFQWHLHFGYIQREGEYQYADFKDPLTLPTIIKRWDGLPACRDCNTPSLSNQPAFSGQYPVVEGEWVIDTSNPDRDFGFTANPTEAIVAQQPKAPAASSNQWAVIIGLVIFAGVIVLWLNSHLSGGSM